MPGGMLQFLHGQILETPPVPEGDLSDKTVIVTGANSGLGLDACKHILKLGPARLILACRNLVKGDQAKKVISETVKDHKVDIQIWKLDMTSAQSLQAFAERCTTFDRLDAVILNAGMIAERFERAGPTEDGDESMVAVHAVGTTFLAILLLPKLRSTAALLKTPTNISMVNTALHAFADSKNITNAPDGRIFETISSMAAKKWSGVDQYNMSKLLSILSFHHMAAVVSKSDKTGSQDVIINMVHPGYCRTPFFGDVSLPQRVGLGLIGRDCEVGSRCLVDGILKGKESHGQYLAECQVKKLSPFVRSSKGDVTSKQVWDELMLRFEKITPGLSSTI